MPLLVIEGPSDKPDLPLCRTARAAPSHTQRISPVPTHAHLELRLPLAEAKAVARLLKIGISAIQADTQPVDNALTLQRAINACKSAAEKIDIALLEADPSFTPTKIAASRP